MPPKSFFAQNVTVRPRSAAASTRAKFPSSTTSGSRRTNCSITQGSSPSPTRRLEPPKELVRDAVRVEQVEEIGDGFVFLNPEQVGDSADPQRSQFRQCRTVPELNAEPRQRGYDPGAFNAHDAWDAPSRAEPSARCWRG